MLPNHKEIDLINEMLASIPNQFKDSKEQLLYERGYLTGLLALLVHNDSAVRVAVMHRLKELKK